MYLKYNKKTQKSTKRDNKKKELEELALKSRESPSKAHLWFLNKFRLEQIERIQGKTSLSQFNDNEFEIIETLITDIYNKGYQYLIEVSPTPSPKSYKFKGIKQFHIVPYDEGSYARFIVEYNRYLETIHEGRLRGLYNYHKGSTLVDLSNKQLQYLKYNNKDTFLKSDYKPVVTKSIILRKAK